MLVTAKLSNVLIALQFDKKMQDAIAFQNSLCIWNAITPNCITDVEMNLRNALI